MKHMKLYLFFAVVCLLPGQANGLTETMYVTDRLHLSLRHDPALKAPSLALLPSDTKVVVLETEDNWANPRGDGLKVQGKWARVRLEDGRTGWVMKRFLVRNVPKSLIIEQLQGQIQEKNIITERFREEIASRDKEIKSLKDQIIQQRGRFKMGTRENTSERLKGISVTGIVTLSAGFVIGYLMRRPQKQTIGFLPADRIRQRLLGSQ
ncbi:MAG: SH3 domain-containing protein [Proteobacteria bacterium]|nr:SH3 domain-containing protein [Pseudomonadota bacterium]